MYKISISYINLKVKVTLLSAISSSKALQIILYISLRSFKIYMKTNTNVLYN